ncbi:HlyD family secretion protein [Gloeobacter morelensis]|uniref:HlyD family efflux transporter periplasmic adaptor subunit n=1 Tax=Gloeobacter morelensis MG652769 TaxID=2781736 RepID=A0ABY3PTP8_9CYAN|nr:HlyD family efflux transporter periplasmic adaptor subunit [Gloeobacter morelensis]UFP96821.1 HlyD family efflux transporter periplasmic adaptor subunit [Gloeobacter morelensis MG652769]
MSGYVDRHRVSNYEPTSLRSLAQLVTPAPLFSLGTILLLLTLLIGLGLSFIPWQQSVVGKGKVMVLSPMQRPQNIEAQIPGRLVRWNIREGQQVQKGAVVAELADLDAKFLDSNQLARLAQQQRVLVAKRTAAQSRIGSIAAQVTALEGSRGLAIPAARQKAAQSVDRERAFRQSLEAAEANLTTASLNVERLRELHSKGLRSTRDLEVAENDFVKARTESDRAGAALDAARREVSVGRFDQDKVVFDTAAGLASARASLASARETLATIESDILKLDVDIENLRSRTEQRIVRAPSDGVVVRLLKVGSGETVKAGDVLAVVAPATTDRAVEIYLSDNDAPLVAEGRPVRLQFAGWPAVQFVGWPSVAVGTFAGRVAVIDAVDDGTSRYRVIVVPDEQAQRTEQPWPGPQYLRPGTEATGWIMLDTVSLGFELWRQFNAFPPTLQAEPVKLKAKKE